MRIQENKLGLNPKKYLKTPASLIDIFGELLRNLTCWSLSKVLSWELASVLDTLQLTYDSTSQYLKYDIGTYLEVPT